MDNIIIRKANINDLENIQKLNKELFILEHDNYDPNLIINWPFENFGTKYFIDMINNQIILVAEKNNNIVGYLAGTIDKKFTYVDKKTAEIENLFILDKYRNLGIGKMLISEFKKICKENNVKRIIVTAASQNIKAINFYKSQGFEDKKVTLKIDM